LESTDDSKRVPIEDTEIFRLFEDCADWVWEQVDTWDWKAQKTVGIQLIRAADSINANLVEGDGRYTSADGLHFFVIARGSARETRLWLKRAIKRKLVHPEAAIAQIQSINSGGRQLNLLIKFRRGNRGQLAVREERAAYDVDETAVEILLFPNSPSP
jgi:four helix bundle protein